MAKFWRDSDLSLEPLSGRTIAVLGFGSQGRAQAQNLRDSGIEVIIGVRSGGPSEASALAAGFEVAAVPVACERSDIIAMLVPERAHEETLAEAVNPYAPHGAAVVFAHGYTVVYGSTLPRGDLQRLLVAPKAIGPQLRQLYVERSGAPALIAAEPGDLELAKAYAKALGCGRRAVIASSFREETETDLFGEQAVLCGGIPFLATAAFEILVEAGYSPEAAYFECLFEVKLIADMMFEHGIAGMVDRISDTAQAGAMVAGPRVVDDHLKKALTGILDDIRSRRFVSARAEEHFEDRVTNWRQSLRVHLIEQVREGLKPQE